jgi:hypothetical protein
MGNITCASANIEQQSCGGKLASVNNAAASFDPCQRSSTDSSDHSRCDPGKHGQNGFSAVEANRVCWLQQMALPEAKSGKGSGVVRSA